MVRGSKALKIERKIKKEEEEMSGHSKWHNINNSFLTATRLSKNESMF